MKIVIGVDRFLCNTRIYKPMTIRHIAAKAQQPIDILIY